MLHNHAKASTLYTCRRRPERPPEKPEDAHPRGEPFPYVSLRATTSWTSIIVRALWDSSANEPAHLLPSRHCRQKHRALV